MAADKIMTNAAKAASISQAKAGGAEDICANGRTEECEQECEQRYSSSCWSR